MNPFGFGAFLTQLDAVFVILQYMREFSNTFLGPHCTPPALPVSN